MKTWVKFSLALWVAVLFFLLIWFTISFSIDSKEKEYFWYCHDKVANEIWDEVNNFVYTSFDKYWWEYNYTWSFSVDWDDYTFYCNVLNKENVELELFKETLADSGRVTEGLKDVIVELPDEM